MAFSGSSVHRRRVVTDRILFVVPIADRFVDIGRIDEAERVVRHHVERLIQNARAAEAVPAHVAETAAAESLKLAELTGHPRWVDLTLELYTACRQVMSRRIIDRLRSALGGVQGVDRDTLQAYVAFLRMMRDDLDRVELEAKNQLESLNVSFERLQGRPGVDAPR